MDFRPVIEWVGEIGRRARLGRVSEDMQVQVLPPLLISIIKIIKLWINTKKL